MWFEQATVPEVMAEELRGDDDDSHVNESDHGRKTDNSSSEVVPLQHSERQDDEVSSGGLNIEHISLEAKDAVIQEGSESECGEEDDLQETESTHRGSKHPNSCPDGDCVITKKFKSGVVPDGDSDELENEEGEEPQEDNLHTGTNAPASRQVGQSIRGCHLGDRGGLMVTPDKAMLRRSPRSQGKEPRAVPIEDVTVQKPIRTAKLKCVEGDVVRKRTHDGSRLRSQSDIVSRRVSQRLQDRHGKRSGTVDRENEHSELEVPQPLNSALVANDEGSQAAVDSKDGRVAARVKQERCYILVFVCF